MISMESNRDKARWKRSEIRLQELQEHGDRVLFQEHDDSLCKKWLASNFGQGEENHSYHQIPMHYLNTLRVCSSWKMAIWL